MRDSLATRFGIPSSASGGPAWLKAPASSLVSGFADAVLRTRMAVASEAVREQGRCRFRQRRQVRISVSWISQRAFCFLQEAQAIEPRVRLVWVGLAAGGEGELSEVGEGGDM